MCRRNWSGKWFVRSPRACQSISQSQENKFKGNHRRAIFLSRESSRYFVTCIAINWKNPFCIFMNILTVQFLLRCIQMIDFFILYSPVYATKLHPRRMSFFCTWIICTKKFISSYSFAFKSKCILRRCIQGGRLNLDYIYYMIFWTNSKIGKSGEYFISRSQTSHLSKSILCLHLLFSRPREL